ncbi:MAG: outer membrane beta-barrel protein [Saprospiraceae bacterium]
MKRINLITILFLIGTTSFAQASLEKGRNQINLGVGLSGWGIPVYLGFDHGTSQDITLGLEVSFRSFNENYNSNTYKHNIIGFSGNGNYHFNRVLNLPRKFDFYAGLNVGFYSWSSPNDYNGSNTSRLGLGGQVGFRYFLSSKTGINLEFGGGNAFSGGKIGLTFKL